MKIAQAEFIRSAYTESEFPTDNFPQFAFAGRSNVGKSSMINCLLQQKKIARISSHPGKTRSLNFIRINRRFYFVDLPGYGYAKVSRQERENWKRLIESYFTSKQPLKGLVQIIDARHGLTELDEEMLEYATQFDFDLLVAATKADKLNQTEKSRQQKAILEKLSRYGIEEFVFFSAKTKLGKVEIWRWIEERLR